jgi:hypothetical protein
MHMATKNDIFKEKLKEYLKATKIQKGLILDTITNVTGLTRKSAIRRFRRLQLSHASQTERRGRPRYYTNDVRAALKEVWEIGSQACAENLHAMIGEYIDTQITANDWNYGDETTAKLRAMSLGSAKVYVGGFMRTRRSFGGKGTTKPSTLIAMVPIRMDGWDKAEVGVVQVDTVAHCGDSTAGDFVYTVNGTDVATLWGTRRAQWQKGQTVTCLSLQAMRADTPFPWTEMHPDSGGEFINYHCLAYANETQLRVTRSRPYHKNDNCFVEERNGHIVRTYVGYGRLDAKEVVAVLNSLYDVLTPYLNHFVASRRIVSKQRVGAKWVVKREVVAKTPYQRVLDRADVSKAVKEELKVIHATLNPKQMKLEIDRLIKLVYAVQQQYGCPRF